ncbi:MAG: galactose oxidase-like domain-containing protein [Paracoccus sp. (in: a-proteobacteria)]
MINPNSQDPEGNGEWGDIQDIGIIPLHSIVLPDGKVLSFGTDERGMQGAEFIYSVWDPKTGENKILENTTGTNIFCSNMAIDPSTGNVIIMGGDAWRDQESDGGLYAGVNDVTIFDYKTQTIREAETGDMSYARWYGSVATLANGEILIVGGRDENYEGSTIPEIYNSETGFRELAGAEISDLADNQNQIRGTYWYPHLWQASNGTVYMIESEGKDDEHGDIFTIDVEGNGSAAKIDTLPFQTRTTTPSIMYDVDKVLIIADDGWVWSGDLSGNIPTWSKAYFIEDENNPGEGIGRTNGSFILLPDGRVAIVGGGESETILGNQLADAQYAVLVWNPETGETETWADQALARLYHSSGQLLPDGTLWSGGGGAPGPLQNTNIEVFTPPYLYDENGNLADRPDITNAPTNIDSGDTFWIKVDDATAIEKLTAIKSGSSTHARNTDARMIKLDFEVVDTTTIRVSTPEANIMSPGVWTVFTVDDDGVPSEGSIIGVDMAAIEVPDPSTLPGSVDHQTYDGIHAVINDFFDQIDGPVFTVLSGFMNGLVDISEGKTDMVADMAQSTGMSLLELLGADPSAMTGTLDPALQPAANQLNSFYGSAYDLVYRLGDAIFRVGDSMTDGFADLGDKITAATGQPTPILDQMEFYTQLVTVGAVYGFTEVSKNIIDMQQSLDLAGLGFLSGLLGLGDGGANDDPFGLFSMESTRQVSFNGAIGVAGLDGSTRTTTAQGDELVYITAADKVQAGGGSDLITLYDGAQQINLGGNADTTDNALALNRGDVTEVVGTAGRDFIASGISSTIDQIQLLNGNDRVFSAGTIRQLDTGNGHDEIEANIIGTANLGAGNDTIVADKVETLINAGSGNDEIAITSGYADGGSGNDTFHFVTNGEGTTFNGNSGWDKLVIDLDEAGITYNQLMSATGTWNPFGGNLILWGREVTIDALDLTILGIDEIAFA